VALAHVRALDPKIAGNQSFLLSNTGEEGYTVSTALTTDMKITGAGTNGAHHSGTTRSGTRRSISRVQSRVDYYLIAVTPLV
jgi:hypothetical protein